MDYSFRWYGPKDPVNLNYIRQSDATGIVTSLHQIPAGYKWRLADIKKRISLINENNNKNNVNLKWNVVESIPVHNNIKLKKNNYKLLIENFKKTIQNISKCNIKTICYNFMPVIDWTRTELDFKLSNDALALRFNIIHILIFEKYILKLDNIESRYNDNQIKIAENLYFKSTNEFIKNLKFSILGGLPAAEKKYSISEFKQMISEYKNVNSNELRNNLTYFLKEIIPVAEEEGVKMCIHPDDPPLSLFGLPRIVSKESDLDFIFKSYKSKSNNLTFCSGSLASNKKNNVINLFTKFAKKIEFIHLRNVIIEKDNFSFFESDHINGDVDFVKLIKMIIREEKLTKSNIPMRPDHGHSILDDQFKLLNPGYSAIGRLKGLAQIKGIVKAI